MEERTTSFEHIRENVPASVPLDDVFDALAARQRRQLLAALRQAGTAEQLSSLASSLAGDPNPAGTESAGHVELQLYHVHVPKLVDAGLLACDGTLVELTEDGETIADVIAR